MTERTAVYSKLETRNQKLETGNCHSPVAELGKVVGRKQKAGHFKWQIANGKWAEEEQIQKTKGKNQEREATRREPEFRNQKLAARCSEICQLTFNE